MIPALEVCAALALVVSGVTDHDGDVRAVASSGFVATVMAASLLVAALPFGVHSLAIRKGSGAPDRWFWGATGVSAFLFLVVLGGASFVLMLAGIMN